MGSDGVLPAEPPLEEPAPEETVPPWATVICQPGIRTARTTYRQKVDFEVSKELQIRMLAGIRCVISADDQNIQSYLRYRRKP